ncbi:MAG TPA: hypothetical protein ENH82_03835 [bacterium]|nr:hypothetical protein [bacterium]
MINKPDKQIKADVSRYLHLAYFKVGRLLETGKIDFEQGDRIRVHLHNAITRLDVPKIETHTFKLNDTEIEAIGKQAQEKAMIEGEK